MTIDLGQRRTLNPNRLKTYRFIYPLFFIVSPVLMWEDHFKMGALFFFLGLVVIGFQFRWKVQYFVGLPDWRSNVLYGLTWGLGIWGLWFDFFTGSAFFAFGALIKGYQMGWNWGYPIRMVLLVLNISIAALLFFLHLKYSAGWGI